MKNKAGISMIETVFVVALVSVVLTGIVVSLVFSLKVNRYAQNKFLAADLARQEIDEIKSKKETDIFWTQTAVDCCAAEKAGTTFACAVSADGFGCNLVCKNCFLEEEEKKVDMAISVWWDSQDEPNDNRNKVIISSSVSNWRK